MFIMTKDSVNNNSNSILSVSVILIIVFLSNIFITKNLKKPKFEIGPQETTVHFNENLVKALILGQYRLSSSVLWSETLLRSDIKHYKKEDLNNWMFRRLNLITTLDPYFYISYLYGAVYLSIIKDDLNGASTIYEKGLRVFPNDFDLNYNAAFHYYFEVGDHDKAVEKLDRIISHPRASSLLKRIYSRLKAEKGNLEDALVVISNLYKNAPQDSPIKERYRKNLFQIKTELDLNCLNQSLNDCPHVNLNGIPYKKQDNQWVSPESWEPFRIKKGPKK